MIDEGSVVFKQGVDQFVHWRLSELRCFLQVADDLSDEDPQVIDMLLNRLLRQARAGEVKKKRREVCDDFLTAHEIPFVPIQLRGHSGRAGQKGNICRSLLLSFRGFRPLRWCWLDSLIGRWRWLGARKLFPGYKTLLFSFTEILNLYFLCFERHPEISELPWCARLLVFSQKNEFRLRDIRRRLAMAGKTKDTAETKQDDTCVPSSREEAMGKILDNLEAQFLKKEGAKGTVADYLRLIQAMKEMGDERPREIEITWVNSLRGEKGR